MQDRYAGDIGDYSKFILLRHLFKPVDDSIGLVWYRYPDESHNEDGRHVQYLGGDAFQAADSELINALQAVVDSGERSIGSLERAHVLPPGTRYFSTSVDAFERFPNQTRQHQQARMHARNDWLQQALVAMQACHVVVLDPDNGLRAPGIRNQYQKKAGKYAFEEEIVAFAKNRRASVIYHHLNRTAPHLQQIHDQLKRLKALLGDCCAYLALRFSAYSARVYFIVAEKSYCKELKRRIHRMMKGAMATGWSHVLELEAQDHMRVIWQKDHC